jgi:hypothetical protein
VYPGSRTIYFLGNVSDLAPSSIKFSHNTLVVYVRFLYRIEPVARKLFTFWKIVFVLRSAHQKIFVLIYEYVAGMVGI